MMSSVHRVEVAVIGAGVLGLACARSLAIKGKEVFLLERASSIGSGTSSRNSEVIHAGLYYRPNSLKAELCVRGRHMLYEYCEQRHIPHNKIGKIVVATTTQQAKFDLPNLLLRGQKNKVHDLKLLSQSDVSYFEPEVDSKGGILSPSTGLVDSHGLMVSLLADAENHGATLALKCNVKNGWISNDEIVLEVDDGTELLCDNVVNCSGLFADQISSKILKTQKEPLCKQHKQTFPENIPPWTLRSLRQFFAKGNYFKLEGQKAPFSHLIYPVPEPGGLGVHATIDLGGNCRFGPDVQWIDLNITNPDDIDLRVDQKRSNVFYEEVRKYWPSLKDGSLMPDYAGIRPKLGHPDFIGGPELKADFVIEGPKQHGVHGFVNLMNMESPGLTSSLAVAEKVAEMMS